MRRVGVAGVVALSGVVAATNPVGAAPRPPPTATTVMPSAAATSPCGNVTTPPPASYDHVIWILMENKVASDVLGGSDAPYETRLARQCGTATRYASVGSPSLPNYIGATSGGIQGLHDDDPPSSHRLTVDNVFRQVRAAGRTERSYQESMRTPCQVTAAGDYATKHNPAAYYQAPGDRAACRRDDVPLGATGSGALHRDLVAGSLATFSFITPSLCHDTHDCSVRTGDEWLARWMPAILSSSTYQAGRTAVFVVWDEYTPMPLIVISPTTPVRTVAAVRLDHYALLRTTEEVLGLPMLGRAGTAPSLRGPFHL